ncbi:MAG TPA: GNAT family N-acetyltransferase [Coleofasciculaceae cyanobacterium]|jgi:ribosomal protein S18 acetylase RimI-like enzyme
MHIRTLQPHEASLFREVRLRALADSPNAFAETLQQAQTQPQTYWEMLTHSLSQPNSHVMFLAEQAGLVVGFTFGLVDRQDSKTGHLGGMWVDPTCRAQGIGSALIAEVLTWAQQRSQTKLELWVTEGNVKAMGLYKKVGFVDTGKRDVLPSNPALQIIQMSLRIFTAIT